MMIFTALVFVAAAFLLGFFIGTVAKPQKPAVSRRRAAEPDDGLEKIREEYSNFLSYDGSVQS